MPAVPPLGPGRGRSAPADPAPAAAAVTGESRTAAFAGQLGSAQLQQVRTEFDEHLRRIGDLGERLAQRLTPVDLAAYKGAVRDFLSRVRRSATALQTETSWDRQTWEQRTLVLIQKVDAELEALSQQVLQQEADHLALLGRIGEIKGLLLDLRL